MKKENKKNIKIITNERIKDVSSISVNKTYKYLNSSSKGLNKKQVEKARDKYGKNELSKKKKDSWIIRLLKALVNPFNVILIVLAVINLVTTLVQNENDFSTSIIIVIMVLLSTFLKFFQETKSGNEAKKISDMIRTTTLVIRKNRFKKEISLKDVVVGDIISLSAGDMIPADVRIIQAKDLFVSQSSLTGESEPVEKNSNIVNDISNKSITELNNIAFMGTNVVSGSALAIVINVGDYTMLGTLAKSLNKKPEKTSFEKGVNSVSKVLIIFMLIMVPIVFLVNGFTKHNWLDAALFALTIAVGLTPEMLPMIMTTCLAKGSVVMSKNKVIVKNINSIQNLGSMDVLCTDKTGTLTQDKVVLEYHLNINGEEDGRVLRHAYLNSYYQTGLKNLVDLAIINKQASELIGKDEIKELNSSYKKVDEVPFDFERRRMSVVVMDKNDKTQMITKGAVEEMLKISSYVEYNGKVLPLDEKLKEVVINKARELASKGMRVIALSQKTNPSKVGVFSPKDENDMVLMGYLAFLDPPKESSKEAIKALNEHGVSVKVLTGDSDRVTKFICEEVGIDDSRVLLGSDIDNLSDEQLRKEVEITSIFAKLSPNQKARIVSILKENGHQVGYMGDGINDTLAMKASDVGISVDTAVDIAKESADIILLEKDLMVLEKGIIEGRKTYVNMIKYIKMTASSNFGNMFSVLVASAMLPFLPMLPVQLLLLNLIYDISCIAIPWDNVDKEYLTKPSSWDAKGVAKFMVCIGPISSIFDIATYLILIYIICPQICGGSYSSLDNTNQQLFMAIFQTGWFIESMLSQTLVIHWLRTEKIPFIKSHANWKLTLLTSLGMIIAISITYTPINKYLGLTSMPGIYYAYLAGIIVAYMLFMSLGKWLYIKKFKKLL